MSVLLAKAQLQFEEWKTDKPVKNPPDSSGHNTYQKGHHDGCLDTYERLIHLIDTEENPKFTPSMGKVYLHLIAMMSGARNDPIRVIGWWYAERPQFFYESDFQLTAQEEIDVIIKFLKQAKGMIV